MAKENIREAKDLLYAPDPVTGVMFAYGYREDADGNMVVTEASDKFDAHTNALLCAHEAWLIRQSHDAIATDIVHGIDPPAPALADEIARILYTGPDKPHIDPSNPQELDSLIHLYELEDRARELFARAGLDPALVQHSINPTQV